MNPDLEKAYSALAAARLFIKEKARYLSPGVISMVPYPIKGYGTLGVTKDMVLAFDPELVVHWTTEELAAVLAHEVFHPWMHHHERLGDKDPQMYNENADRVINPIVRDMGFRLPNPDQAMWPSQLGLPEGLTVEEYYEKDLKERKRAFGRSPSPQGGKGPGTGKCGGCASNPQPGEPPPRSDSHNEGKDGPNDNGGVPRGRSDAEVGRMIRRLAEAAEDHAKTQGSLPAGLDRLVKATLAPPKVSWRQQLNSVVTHTVTYREGAVVPRYSGISRKQWGIGIGPGKPILPVWFKTTPRVCVGADTSGSMSQQDLQVTLRETNGVIRATEADITLVVFDAEVHGLKEVKNIKEACAMLKGGGGSDCRPAFEALRKLHPTKRPNMVIIATDGFLSVPEFEPQEFKSIWLLIGKNARPPCSWGTAIRVEQ